MRFVHVCLVLTQMHADGVVLTQIDTDGLRWDTDIFYYIICALSVLILFICGLFSDEGGYA